MEVIRCPLGKPEPLVGLPLPQGQKFTVRKTTSLRKEDDDSSSMIRRRRPHNSLWTCEQEGLYANGFTEI